MEMDAILNTILTGVVCFIVWWAKSQSDETNARLTRQIFRAMMREYFQ